MLREKVNHLLSMDVLKLFTKTKEELEVLLQTVTTTNSDTEIKFDKENYKCVGIIEAGKSQVENNEVSKK